MSDRLNTATTARRKRRPGRLAATVIGVLLIVAAAVAAWYFLVRSPDDEAAEVLRSGEATVGSLDITVSASGSVAAERQIDLSFSTAGTVAEVLVDVGDSVVPGQALAELDRDAAQRSVRQAELALEQAELNLIQITTPADENEIRLAERAVQQALAAMQAARTSEQLAATQGQRSIEIASDTADKLEEAYLSSIAALEKMGQSLAYAAGITAAYMEAEGNVGITQLRSTYEAQSARSQWLSAYNSYIRASQNLEQLTAGADDYAVGQAELQIAQAELALTRAQDSLADTILYAPFGGIITAVNLQRGQSAAPALPAASLVDPASLYIELAIDEIDIGRIQVGQTATIVLDAYPGTILEGSVESIGLLPSAATGVITYEVRVKIVPQGSTNIRKGMTATVVISVEQKHEVLIVPNWAVRTDQTTGETYAYRLRDGVPERITVETGGRDENGTEILSGLTAGDTVVLVNEAVALLQFQGPPSRGN